MIPTKRFVGRGMTRTRGFTLIEVLVALSVFGVATYIFISLFNQGLVLGTASRNGSVAPVLAEERMTDIQRNGAAYDWTRVRDAAEGELAPVRLLDSPPDSEQRFEPPSALPGRPEAATRETTFYTKFAWEAYGRKPASDDPAIEVIVVVRWEEQARKRSFALTSLVPRDVMEGQS